MKLNQGETTSIFPINNWVLIRPILDVNKTQTKGISLLLDTTYKPEHHSRVYGEVISMPKQLIFSKKHPKYSMEWECEPNIKIGEKVIINYLAGLNAEKYHWLMDGEEKLFLVPYQKIYMVFRKGKPIMLNGYVLVERDVAKKESQFDLLEKKAERTGVVRYCHEPNLQYLGKGEYDDNIIHVGDRVLMSYKHYKTLEDPLHRIFSDVELLVCQRHQLGGVI